MMRLPVASASHSCSSCVNVTAGPSSWRGPADSDEELAFRGRKPRLVGYRRERARMETGDGIRCEHVNRMHGSGIDLQWIAAGIGVYISGRLGREGTGLRFDARVIEVAPSLDLSNGVEFESAANGRAWHAGALNFIQQADACAVHGKEIMRAGDSNNRNNR